MISIWFRKYTWFYTNWTLMDWQVILSGTCTFFLFKTDQIIEKLLTETTHFDILCLHSRNARKERQGSIDIIDGSLQLFVWLMDGFRCIFEDDGICAHGSYSRTLWWRIRVTEVICYFLINTWIWYLSQPSLMTLCHLHQNQRHL